MCRNGSRLASSLSEALAEPSPGLRKKTARYVASMSIQKEFDVRNPPSDWPRMVERKRNSGMRCANPHCSKELLYLREGSLQLLELESDSDDQSRQDDGAFAMKPLRSKFFGFVASARRHKSLSNGQLPDLS